MDPRPQAGPTERLYQLLQRLGTVHGLPCPPGGAKEVLKVLSLFGFLEGTLKRFIFECGGGKERDFFLWSPRSIWEGLLQTHFLKECGDIFHLVAGWGHECRKHLGWSVGQTMGAEGKIRRARVRGLRSPGRWGAQGEEG